MTTVTSPAAQKRIIPLVLCGGSGSRLWPLSRWNKPKQFLRLLGQHSLLETTLLRCRNDIFDVEPIIVGAETHGEMLRQTVADLGINADIILEPDRRDSCAAIVAGVLIAAQRDPDALVMMMAADHDIPDIAAFSAAARQAAGAAAQGHIVTFGVKPLNPATGYGYIFAGNQVPDSSARKVERFVEKPDLETAKYYLQTGYLWNSGNFMFSANALLDDANRFVPQILSAVKDAVRGARQTADGLLLDKTSFSTAPRISFDYAIMEKTERAAVLPVGYAWSDIGSWDAVADMLPKNADKNSIVGQGEIQKSKNVFVHSEGVVTVVVGCNDISIIATPQAVLVVRKGQSENIKSVLDTLKVARKV
jgi:mannose-1-phosphate guanylyltransferase / mannose-6-phosphate isomerase